MGLMFSNLTCAEKAPGISDTQMLQNPGEPFTTEIQSSKYAFPDMKGM